MQAQLIRRVVRVNLDVSGNISVFLRIRDIELENKYVRLSELFTEVKILSMKATLVPSTQLRNSALGLGTLMSAVVHDDYTGLQLIGDQLLQIPNVKIHVLASFLPCTQVWHRTKGDASEEEFYSCQGTSLSPVLPSSLGGIVFWADGPVVAAGTYVCDIILEYHALFRGMRND